MAWICKRCGNDKFRQPYRASFIIIDADKNQEIIESEDNVNAEYGRFYCDKCKKSGWTLDKVAEWMEE